MTKLEELEKDFSEYLVSIGVDQVMADLIIPFVRLNLSMYVGTYIQLKLDENDRRAIEAEIVKSDLDNEDSDQLYVSYFIDKTDESIEDIARYYYDSYKDAIEKSSKLFTKIVQKVAELPKEEREKELSSYFSHIEQRALNNIKNYKI